MSEVSFSVSGMDGMLHLKGSFHALELTGHIQSMEIRVRGG